MIISDTQIILKVVIQWFVYFYSIITQDEGQRSLCIVSEIRAYVRKSPELVPQRYDLCRKDLIA